jgi:UDP-3-O-[3-hydroxymyristoyl] glucosamine N-acyltransferase
MEHPGFFERAGPFKLSELLDAANVSAPPQADLDMQISDVVALDEAGRENISFFDNRKYLENFLKTRAAACFVSDKFADRTPDGTIALLSVDPYRSFALALAKFYPDAMRPRSIGSDPATFDKGVHKSAYVEPEVTIEHGTSIGPEVQIGKGTVVAAGARIGYRVCIGRNCYVGPNTVLVNSLIGNHVIIHAGACIGQDGFGFAMGREGHLKVPQIGKVVIQDDVEIGANCTIDRGALKDTIIGQGTKIDNLVQIGHNVVIGRNCVIVSQVGIAGSAELGEGVALGGQVGVNGHVKVGAGAQIAATSTVRGEVPPGARWGGTPAKPISVWFREIALLQRLAEDRGSIRRKSDATKS